MLNSLRFSAYGWFVIKPLPSLLGVRVLVAGDVMLDRYWYGEAERVSQEAPVPVVDVKRTELFPGGAANTALTEVTTAGDGSSAYRRATTTATGTSVPSM